LYLQWQQGKMDSLLDCVTATQPAYSHTSTDIDLQIFARTTLRFALVAQPDRAPNTYWKDRSSNLTRVRSSDSGEIWQDQHPPRDPKTYGSSRFGVAIFFVSLVLSFAGALAQDVPTKSPKGHGLLGRWMSSLSSHDAKKVLAAYEKATRDRAVRVAKRRRDDSEHAYNEALRAAMVRADPAVEPLIKQMPERKRHY
jgi:hypothetical protein